MIQLYPLVRVSCLVLLFFLLWSPVQAQNCYPDFYVYQVSPYGPLCSPGYVTLRADSYQGESGQYVSGEFRWYSGETSTWPVQTTQIWGSNTTSDYMVYAEDGKTVWVSYFDNNTWCESSRVAYTFSITSPPTMSVEYAKSCEPGTAEIKLSGAPSGGTYRLYKYQNGYLNLVQSNSTGLFMIQGYDRANDHDLYQAQIYMSSGCGNTVYYPLHIDAPDPTPPTVSGTLTVCQGTGTVLSATGGENSYTFRWYDGAGNQLIEGTQFTVPSTLAAGTYYYSVQGVSATDCHTEPLEFAVTINLRPVDSSILANGQTGSAMIYLGQKVTISSIGGVGTPHYWYSSNEGASWNELDATTIGQSNFEHEPSSTGVYTYRVKNRNECGFCDENGGSCGPEQLVRVTVLAPPTVHIATSSGIGIGFGTSLKASVSDGSEASFTWSPAVGLNSTAGAVIKANPVTTTTYTVTATWRNGYTSMGTVTVSPGGNNHNYIVESVMMDKYKTYEELHQLPAREFRQQVSYFDGLGRASQKVAQRASPLEQDIVTPVEYDQLGREARKFLPYAADEASGFFKPNALGDGPSRAGADYLSDSYLGSRQYKFYQQENGPVASGLPFSQAILEASPLNRVLEQGAPGEAWQPAESGRLGDIHTVKVHQRANAVGEVRQWEYSSSDNFFVSPGYYAAGSLFVTETYDEQDALVVEYKNLQGQVVAKKVQEIGSISSSEVESGFMITQYIYDSFGNLRLVIQPEGYRSELPGPDVNGHVTLSSTLTPVFLKRWCFRYEYDGRRRVIEKQVPGAGAVYMVYDLRDLPVLTQDAEQRLRDEWGYVRYDAHGRSVETGLYRPGEELTQGQMQQRLTDFYIGDPDQVTEEHLSISSHDGRAVYEASGSITFLPDFSFAATSTASLTARIAPATSLARQSYFPGGGDDYEALTQTFYDNYGQPELEDYNFNGTIMARLTPQNTRVLGLVTGTRTKVLGTGEWLTNVTFYDEKYRVIQTLGDGFLEGKRVAGWERTGTVYDFAGQPEETLAIYQVPARDPEPARIYRIYQQMSYDHAGRHTKTVQQIDGHGPEMLAENSYNELGQLITKRLHKKSNSGQEEWERDFLQEVDFRYNIRGWLTDINNPELVVQQEKLFGMKLSYNTDMQLGGLGQYNGNISEMRWATISDEGKQRGYAYAYDRASRLTEGLYRSNPGAGWTNIGENYTVSGITYDANGNIGSMERHGLLQEDAYMEQYTLEDFGPVDNLKYDYAGNQLINVKDEGGDVGHKDYFRDNGHTDENAVEYGYDLNGNLEKDDNKGITSVAYNHLNLPERVEVADQGHIRFIYTAAGQKLRKEVYDTNNQLTSSTEYAGPFVFEGGALQFAHTSEGRALYQPTADEPWRFEYHLKDHLGNLRVSFAEPTSLTAELTMEMMAAPQEEENFGRVSETRHLDRGRSRSGSHAALLGAGRGKPLGPGRRLTVRSGDRVKAEVYGLYEEEVKSNKGLNLAAWLLGSATAGVGTMTELGNGNGKALPYIGAGIALAPVVLQKEKGAPVAYMRYIAYGKDSSYVDSGYQLLTRLANGEWEKLELAYTAKQDGFVEVFLANESYEAAWFDDMSVQHLEQMLVQENHYDPWGLNLAGIEKQGAPDHLFQYNGKEKQTELGLNWMDYGARMYDAQLGRFHTQDRFAEKYLNFTPYQYGANNPIRFIDINGDSIGVHSSISSDFVLNRAFNHFASSKVGRAFLSQYAKKGQTIAGYTFTEDGQYHKDGIHLNYEAKLVEDDEVWKDRGKDSRGSTNAEGNTITVFVNSYSKVNSQDGSTYDWSPSLDRTSVATAKQMGRGIFSRTMTFFHESFIHADLFAKDYQDNGLFDYSNISSRFKTPGLKEHWQHFQVLYNKDNSLWPGGAKRGLIEVNSGYQYYSNEQISKMIWDYNGGKR
ncbi:DUF6443 domain-containing protein [Pontibacter amylolyticus]|uniref:RHS repeat-associated core domain-containing protein n=1 Tax=Pontibacter amylolyticus TaxID=1424080 RepID=A0ABQ1W7I0_9BACT|nr:DUF6443 domain-containing protein [Pontibacter amylolyticus]GGG19023.1 hypothetical protein GCM10011323_23940 [Pontibacter amylolyticus]